ncbi:hypothetical protein SLEP1_g49267 [Rubroshorea leprosula]|uniref:Uncharacterized protein n=1 Tax=Rubroshorea leprosula TaxID=152421 RepID=A0AAV5LX39_9ROSI|nr:hypothetical protein SLEP1_g19512 [Rubroshorea leprosula]GKV41775.1 hypothetical protein SLEP1_g49267 [Rubroshorea leprosula]
MTKGSDDGVAEEDMRFWVVGEHKVSIFQEARSKARLDEAVGNGGVSMEVLEDELEQFNK